VVFSDTVGFIRKLPHQLVESFKSTLEEVALADLLLHVADCSDPKMQEHIEQTREVLAEIGAESVPYLIVYNKLDANPEFAPPSNNSAPGFAISALQSRGLAALKAELVARAGRPRTT
jgi:GTP-binding protein HflX